MKYTDTQNNRLIELGVPADELEQEFETTDARDKKFYSLERKQIKAGKEKLQRLLRETHVPAALKCRRDLENWLIDEEDFTQVSTQIIISADKIEKMNIESDNHLRDQIFWVGKNKCLRPMHAPNLYEMMRDIHKITNEAVRIFEVGSCFRKESQGAKHLNEFTMLNLVELAAGEDGYQVERLQELAAGAMAAVGIKDYKIVTESSGVYGTTVDIEYKGIEIASGAYGPHPLDANWGVFDTWVGLGIGVERLAMALGNHNTIKAVSKNSAYLDGISLKLK